MSGHASRGVKGCPRGCRWQGFENQKLMVRAVWFALLETREVRHPTVGLGGENIGAARTDMLSMFATRPIALTNLVSPPRNGLARGIPVEVERITLVIDDSERLTAFDGLAARKGPFIEITVQ